MSLTDEERILLPQVQPGDEVAQRRGSAWNRATVTRVTRTQVIIGDRRYWKQSGSEVGYAGISNRYIAPLTEQTLEAIADWERALHRNRLVNRIRAAKLRDLPLEVLEQVAEMVKATE